MGSPLLISQMGTKYLNEASAVSYFPPIFSCCVSIRSLLFPFYACIWQQGIAPNIYECNPPTSNKEILLPLTFFKLLSAIFVYLPCFFPLVCNCLLFVTVWLEGQITSWSTDTMLPSISCSVSTLRRASWGSWIWYRLVPIPFLWLTFVIPLGLTGNVPACPCVQTAKHFWENNLHLICQDVGRGCNCISEQLTGK